MTQENYDDLIIVSVSELDENDFLNLAKDFDCGDADLNAFLIEEALPYQKYGLTYTYLVFKKEISPSNLIGFYSLSSDSLKLEGVALTDLGLPFNAPLSFFPAVKLTKLAVGTPNQSKGFGAHFIKLIIGSIFSSSTMHAAVRLLTVNAVNRPNTIKFYETQGFIECIQSPRKPRKGETKKAVKTTILMYKDIYSE